MNFMGKKHSVQAAAVFFILLAAGFVAGCAAKSTDAPAAPPSATDAKMGNDYGKGVAAAHASQQQNH